MQNKYASINLSICLFKDLPLRYFEGGCAEPSNKHNSNGLLGGAWYNIINAAVCYARCLGTFGCKAFLFYKGDNDGYCALFKGASYGTSFNKDDVTCYLMEGK